MPVKISSTAPQDLLDELQSAATEARTTTAQQQAQMADTAQYASDTAAYPPIGPAGAKGRRILADGSMEILVSDGIAWTPITTLTTTDRVALASRFYPSSKANQPHALYQLVRREYLNNTGGPYRVALLGDSILGYMGATLLRALERSHGVNGLGYDPLDAGRYGTNVTLTKSGTWTTYGSGNSDPTSIEKWGVSGNSITADAGASVTYAPSSRYPFDTFRVWYYKGPGKGQFTYAVDGGASTTVDTSAASAGLGYVEVQLATNTSGAPGTHSLVLTVSSGNVTLYGVETWSRRAYGVAPLYLNTGGTQAAHWATAAQNGGNFLQAFLAVTQPAQSLVMLGANDAGTSKRTGAQFEADMTTLLGSFTPPRFSDTLLLTPWWRGTEADASVEDTAYKALVQEYRSRLLSLARTRDVSLWDLQRYWPSHPDAWSGGLYADLIHPSNLGAAYWVAGFMRLLPQAVGEAASLDSDNTFSKSLRVLVGTGFFGAYGINTLGDEVTSTTYETGFSFPFSDGISIKLAGSEVGRVGFNGNSSAIFTGFPTSSRSTVLAAFRQGSTSAPAMKVWVDASNKACFEGVNGNARLARNGVGVEVTSQQVKLELPLGFTANTPAAGAYTMSATDAYVRAQGNVTLPNITSSAGTVYIIKNITGSGITVTPASTETIDGATSLTLNANQTVRLYSTGSRWDVL
ncbi:SGNH/GDSL hydrolase family protein [Deinococcus peraridilitoris]|uniref:SGNH hydrolase-type esterase domain-containing protein n=1 Tax=Deinococcus peraridilitoris (strain DSM 19664 / LMG 22246 / CIP 109416 / KR-200) TaxID=937777 RepID=L0A327_DEIPD|nr:SGNH/GDSL hydrolase family protein [Deinococcus peraridilitoris]AFZ67582.1 hypothetical protein Deipe_2086 [Deinococcus peraridilitoris DSM 19664]